MVFPSRAEGQFETTGGVSLVAGQALPAVVVIQVAGADAVHLPLGELCAFHVNLHVLSVPLLGAVRHGAQGVHREPVP